MAGKIASLPKISLESFALTARADYRFAPLNALLLLLLMLIGLIVHVVVHGFDVVGVVYSIVAALALIGMLRL
ncbi:MAG: hypothetical protein ACYS7M_11585, partial [Planctomycetota bacterium]